MDARNPAGAGQRWFMLVLATVGFAVNFWAWALLSPLGTRLKDSLHLSPFEQSLVVAVAVIVGSLGLALLAVVAAAAAAFTSTTVRRALQGRAPTTAAGTPG